MEDHYPEKYLGIIGYEDKDIQTLGKQELLDIFKESGIKYSKFYYPFPDYKMPYVVYTDERLPLHTELSTLLYYNHGLQTYNYDYRVALDGLLTNNMFGFFSNSFLVEIGNDRTSFSDVVFAKTSKALTRLNEMFRTSEVKKTYWAVVKNAPKEPEGELVHFLVRNEKQNKSYAYDKEVPKSKKAILDYRLIGRSENYYLLEVDLKTGRHHQIRCQLAKMGCPIKGDLKYGSPRSNPDGSICLHARRIRFVHPVSKELIELEAPLPEGNLWKGFELF